MKTLGSRVSWALCAAFLLFAAACSSDSSTSSVDGQEVGVGDVISEVQIQTDGQDAQQETGLDGEDTAAEALSDTTDEQQPGDGVDDSAVDAQPEVADETAETAETAEVDEEQTAFEGFSVGFLVKTCDKYCDVAGGCGVDIGDSCSAQCVATISGDPETVYDYLCWTMTGTCVYAEACTALDITLSPLCEELCADASACGMFPSQMLGTSLLECHAQCSTYKGLTDGSPEGEAVMGCVVDAVAECDGVAMLACTTQDGDSVCQEVCDPLETCDNIPGVYPSMGDCMSTCESYDVGPAVAALACTSFGLDDFEEPQDPENPPPGEPSAEVCEAQSSCFPPPTALALGSTTFCATLIELCADEPGFELPADVDVCAWLMTGFAVRIPGVDFVHAALCAEELENCDQGGDTIMSCLIPRYEPCEGYCEALDTCLTQGPEPPEDWPGVEGCVIWCSSLHSQQPDIVDAAIACVAVAPDCGAMGVCIGEGDGQ